MSKPDPTKIIAVSYDSFTRFGCPHCGFKHGNWPITGNGAGEFVCGECGKNSVILADGVEKSPYRFGEQQFQPIIQKHPREGIPAHEKEDKQPEGGGEFFRPRGVGTDKTPGCFVCGGHHGLYTNLSGFVDTKPAGERVLKMFKQGAWLDYRENEPTWIQVKIGACTKHEQNLEKLNKMSAENQIITAEMVAAAMK